MIDSLTELDKRVFLALNQWHSAWLDPIMFWFSGNLIWLPLYAFLLYQLYKLPRIHFVVALLSIAAGIAMADQFTSALLKPLVGRPRPTWDAEIGSLVHVVNNYRGGHFGFPSSHAANTFCVAVLLMLIWKNPWARWLLLWATLVSYSRIYLGVHFPVDVIAGAAAGSIFGVIAFRLYRYGCKTGEKLIVDNG